MHDAMEVALKDHLATNGYLIYVDGETMEQDESQRVAASSIEDSIAQALVIQKIDPLTAIVVAATVRDEVQKLVDKQWSTNLKKVASL